MPGATPPQVLLAAHLPAMIRNAGELADGLVSTWAVRSSLEAHLVPRVREAASAAGRPEPRVLASVLVSVTEEPSRVRTWVAETYGVAATFPGYRDTLDRGGAEGVGDTVVAGDEKSVEASLHGLAEAGLTDLVAIPIGSAAERASTYDVLARTATPGRTGG